MKLNRTLSALAALFFCVAFALVSVLPAQADDLTNSAEGHVTSLTLSSSGTPYTLTQGESYSVTFSFTLEAQTGVPFKEGDTYVFNTNLGEIFTITGANTLEVRDTEGNLLATVTGASDAVKITIKAGADEGMSIQGTVTTPAVTVIDVGATKDEPVDKRLTVGEQAVAVRVYAKDSSVSPDYKDPGTVDFNDLWKNAGSHADRTSAWTSIEVNPEGSIQLYLSGNAGRTEQVETYREFVVKDTLPGHGHIDPESVEIYAAIPAVGTSSGTASNPYGYPAGTLYAVRQGTDRRPINGRNINHQYDSSSDIMTLLYQEPGETLEQFEARLRKQSLSWGIYHDIDANTETLLVNFGNIGDPKDNNGITYSDYRTDLVDKYPQIFGADGQSGGNIVSYYIEFDSVYPDVVGAAYLTNHASRSAYQNDSSTLSTNGNDAYYTIVNGQASGTVAAQSLTVKLVDEDNHSLPIAGAGFKLQQLIGGIWKDTALSGTTGNEGMLTFAGISAASAEYRIVQTSTAEPYELGSSTFVAPTQDDGLPAGYQVESDGTFATSPSNAVGFAALVTNRRPYQASYEFVSSEPDRALPNEVMALLPAATSHYTGDTVTPTALKTETVSIDGEGVWTFEGWDEQSLVVNCSDITFTGTWSFSPYRSPLNRMPSITASDVVIYVGDPYDATMHEATASDPEDGDLSDAIKLAGVNGVDNMTPGVYTVWFSVADKEGATAKTSATVTVLPKLTVSYEWSGLPDDSATSLYDETGAEAVPQLPGDVHDLRASQQVNVDKDYVAGTTFYEKDDEGSVVAAYTFSGWSVKSPDDVSIEDGMFVMPDEDVTLVGVWERKDVPPTQEPPINEEPPVSTDVPPSTPDPKKEEQLPETGDATAAAGVVLGTGLVSLFAAARARARR